jgi:hypothetical protein
MTAVRRKQLRQFGDVRCNPSRLVTREQLDESLLVPVVCSGADKTQENGPGVGRGRLRYTPGLQKLPEAGSERPAGAPTTKYLM